MGMVSGALPAGLLRRPVVVAPMAAGPTTPELVIAAARGGALGFLAGAYLSVDAMAAQLSQVRAATGEAFGINLFVPGAPTTAAAQTARYLASLGGDAAALGVSLGEPSWDDDAWAAKIAALLAEPPPVVSFTFGCPAADIVAAFRAAGSVVVITVTSPDEAAQATAAGADCLCVQGIEAGAHRGLFRDDGAVDAGVGVIALIGQVAEVSELPQLAAGGIARAAGVEAVLAAGAVAAQCGTVFLRCHESGASAVHKAALADPAFTATALTRAFSGRPARALVNGFLRDHPDAPAAFPEINNATRPLRAAAARAGDTGRLNLWAGTGFREAIEAPAAEIINRLSPPGR